MTLDLPLVFTVLMGLAILAYVVLDGYDLGVGMLMPAATAREQNFMVSSIGPFWDANETWLVLGVGLLLVAFPAAHGIVLTALYLPVFVMLVGLMLRGVAFEFRIKAEGWHRELWNWMFWFGSFVASFAQGISRSGAAPRKAVVIGGGPAGLEAARVLSERGHRVVLFEAAAELGGQVTIAARANWRRDLIGIVDWFRTQLDRLRVDVRWNTLADADDVMAEEPDIVIVATGGIPDSDLVPGGDLCLSTWDVLSGGEISGSVLVYDDNGQHQGPSCADYLSDRPGVDVEIVTPDRAVAIEMGALNYPIFLQHFYAKGVKMTPDHRLTSVIRENNRLHAEFSNEFGQRGIHRVVDHVVVEHGTLPADELYWSLRDRAANEGVTDYTALLAGREQLSATGGFALFRVGDAVSSRNIHAAIYDSLRLCKDL